MTEQTSNTTDYGSALRLMWRNMGGRFVHLSLAVVAGVVAGIAEVIPAWAIWQAVSRIALDSTNAQNVQLVYRTALICLIALMVKAVFFAISAALAHLVAFDVIADIRLRLGRAWNAMSVGSVAKVHSARAKTVALDHCEKLELFIAHMVPETAAAISVWLSLTIWFFIVDWRLAIATVALTPIAFATMVHAMRANNHRKRHWVAANSAMGAAILDFLTAMPVIRVFYRANEEHQRTSDAVRRNAELQSAWGKAFVLWGAPFSTLVASSIAVIAPVAAVLLATNAVDISTVLLFLVLGPTYPVPLVTLFYRLVALPMLSHGAVEIEQQLRAEPDPLDKSDLVLSNKAGSSSAMRWPGAQASEVRFEKVSFSYTPDVLALDQVSFVAEAGKVTALVGLSGAGKSTIGELIAGFYTPDSGIIKIGGVNIAEMQESELYTQVAAVFQKPHLLAGTIRENVTLARPDIADAPLRTALEAAAADSFIDELPHGLDTLLGEGGAGLSGGQKQRLAIARALVANRPVLILDEATAATDPDNDALIQLGLERLAKGRTVIVIAHRLGTIRHADCINVLHAGRIVESGTHEELMALGGYYARLWRDNHEALGHKLGKSEHRRETEPQ